MTENRGRAEAAGAWVARVKKWGDLRVIACFAEKDGAARKKQRDFSGVKMGLFKGERGFLRGGKGVWEGLEMLKVKRQGNFFRFGAV